MNANTLRILVIVSLAVNVFVVGAVSGAFIHSFTKKEAERRMGPFAGGPRGGMGGGGGGGNPLIRAGDRLRAEKQEAYREHLRAAGAANQANLEMSRAARDKIAEVFSAPTFDPAAANAALAAARTAEQSGRERLESAVVEFAKTLNVEERKALAEGLRRPPGRGGRGPGMGRGMGGPGMGPGMGGPGMGPGGPPPG